MLETIKRVLLIELGTLLFALAVGMFLLPGSILTGGVAGIVSLIHPFLPLVSEDIMVIIISTSLFIIGSIFLGKTFTTNTIIHSVSYPFMLLLVTRILLEYEIDPILASIYGGVIGGIGIGIIFRQGGSTGGMDVIPLILEKYFNIEATKGIMFFDAITVIAGLFIYGINNVLIGLISVFFTSSMMERTIKLYGGITAKKVEIISSKYQEISSEIHSVLERGTTLYDVKGGYTKDDKQVVMCIITNKELQMVRDIINKYDDKAFVIITETKDVNGEGFTFGVRL